MTKGYFKIFFSYSENDTIQCIQQDLINKSYIEYNKNDISKIIQQKPEIVVVENLATSYKDVERMLQAGISVYALFNVVYLESVQDQISSILGYKQVNVLPDSIFEQADEIKLIENTDSEIALKELTIQYYLENLRNRSSKLIDRNDVYEHILVCLSPSPSNAKIIKTAARMKNAFNSQFSAIFVETPNFKFMSDEDKKRLRDNQKLAQNLGAHVEVVYGEDVPYQIAEFARLSGVTKIVIGRSVIIKRKVFGKPLLTEELLSYAPDIDIHIIPDKNMDGFYRPKSFHINSKQSVFYNTLKSILILIGATLLSIVFSRFGFTDSNIIMVYILGVLLTSVATSHQLYSLVSSIASVIIFNYLFTVPRFSLAAYGTGYPVTFVVMFLTAYITGNFAIRYKEQAGQSAKIAYRTKILFDTSQILSKAKTKEDIINTTANQLIKLLERNIVVYENIEGKLSEPYMFLYSGGKVVNMEKELACAKWVLRHNHVAGATTDVYSDVDHIYFSLRVNDRVYGVVGIEAKNNPLDAYEHEILLSILGESALTLENEKIAREKEAAAILAESEQLRANILRSISHDLRTPLTTISGNASHLLRNGNKFDEDTLHQIYTDIYNDSIWLINLVENLLYATRFEEGRMTLQFSDELMSEIIETAIQHVNLETTNHTLDVISEDDLLLVKADAKLMVQVVINIIDNAIKYSPSNTNITVCAKRNGNMAEVQIADMGKGIPDDEKEKVFDKFYYGNNKIVDNRRSLGLGLYLCKSIVEAHGGKIYAIDNQPQGTIFGFTLPLKEINLNE